ncbi:MAG: rhodanese-like domain-containing protein [Desulfobulbaceae bacterium]|nr:rhodanese-like domain-containing protein [Desulfobulbaceae bacterium]
MNTRTIALIPLFFLFLTTSVMAGSYNYVDQDTFKNWLESSSPMNIVDIQVKEEFPKHHFKNAIETNAYPVKTDKERARIDKAVTAYKENNHKVVVVCPRGGGGAKRCYDYMKAQGVPEKDLVILKGGVEKWPHKEMLLSSAH